MRVNSHLPLSVAANMVRFFERLIIEVMKGEFSDEGIRASINKIERHSNL